MNTAITGSSKLPHAHTSELCTIPYGRMKINTTRHAWYLNGWILICDRYRPTGSEAIQGCLESCPTRSCRPLNSSKCSMLSVQVTVLLPFILPSTKSLDVNVNNIYVSDIDGPSPIAKLGDLGNCKCSFLHPYLLTSARIHSDY